VFPLRRRFLTRAVIRLRERCTRVGPAPLGCQPRWPQEPGQAAHGVSRVVYREAQRVGEADMMPLAAAPTGC
jgi:hypothetical protein